MALTPDKDSSTMPAELTFQCVNEFVHDINTHFEQLQALCLGLANELDKVRQKPNCNNCANRGLVNELLKKPSASNACGAGIFVKTISKQPFREDIQTTKNPT